MAAHTEGVDHLRDRYRLRRRGEGDVDPSGRRQLDFDAFTTNGCSARITGAKGSE